MPTSLPVIMPIIFIALLLLPIRLNNQQMKGLAFVLWLIGGLFLAFRGVYFMVAAPEQPDALMLLGLGLIAIAIGFGKGKFVLSKTSGKNIERIDQFTEPKRPLLVYSLRSWIIIAIMVGISVSLTIFNTPLLWRGAINLAIGFSLIISSLAYLRALSPANSSAS